MIWTFALIFFLCECGELVLSQFDAFNNQLYQCNWYLFSMEMQRMLVIFMINTQQPPTIHGFANTRDAFKGVNVHRAG